MERTKIYVCSPLSAPTEEGIKANQTKAQQYASKINKMLSVRAIAPHSFLPDYIDDNVPEERELALQFGLDLLKICNGIVVCGNKISKGMASEIAFARKFEIPVIHYKENGPVSTLIFEDGTQIVQLFPEEIKENKKNSVIF